MKREHAVVIGGSMGGLLAARVLSNSFERVTLIERDELPAGCEQRRGVPQGRHTHGLLASGRQVLERLFPGLSDELLQQGAVGGDIVNDSRWFHEGGCLARVKSGLDGLLLSRPMLEAGLRRRTRALPNIAVREDATVVGLMTGEGHGRVTGVRVAGEIGAEEIGADLVVDATGRGSKSPEWLATLGYEAAGTDRIETSLCYTTRHFRREAGHLGGDVAAIIPSTPEGKRGGVMVAQEGGRWVVTLIAHFCPAAPASLDGFREFARALPAPYIWEVIRDAEPAGEPATARFPASIRRRYEKLSRFPEGFLVFGDAICSFNPIYGQGMSVAALEAEALGKCLREGDEKLARRFFRAAARVVDIPWAIAAGNDLRMAEAGGQRSAGVRLINWYMARLHRAAHRDAVLSVAFHRVANLLAPPESLFRPEMVWRTFLGRRERPDQGRPRVHGGPALEAQPTGFELSRRR